jgi:hypothetical protein
LRPLCVLLYPPQRGETPATPHTARLNAKGVASLSIKALTVGEAGKDNRVRQNALSGQGTGNGANTDDSKFPKLHSFRCNFIEFGLRALIMEYDVDSLIFNVLRNLPPCQIQAGEADKRYFAAVCKTNEPDPLPCPVFRP